jgi:hypothetical protein
MNGPQSVTANFHALVAPVFTFDMSSAAPTYGDAPFSAAGYLTTNSTGAVTFALGAGSVGCAVTTGGQVTITSAAIGGSFCVLDASIAADSNYLAAGPVEQSFHIARAGIVTVANNASRELGAPNPSFTGTLSGVVAGDGITASFSSTATSTSAPGTYPITATLHDPNNRLGNYTVTSHDGVLTIVDTTPPVIDAVTPSQNSIWPPNKTMTPITIAASAHDLSGASCHIASVSSNEPGSGQWQITGPLTLTLQADRLGNGSGRIYTIGVSCTDGAGNAASSSTTVRVPHDQGR